MNGMLCVHSVCHIKQRIHGLGKIGFLHAARHIQYEAQVQDDAATTLQACDALRRRKLT